MTQSEPSVLIDVPPGPAGARVGTITLNRRDKRNALTPEMLGAVTAGVRTLCAGPEPVRAIVLAGTGEVFCSGFDMRTVHADGSVLVALLRGLSGAIRALRRCPVPVVCAAHGAAVAGGCALLGGCDVIVTNLSAKLGYPVLKIGLSPAVTAPALRTLVGDGCTRERTLEPELIDGSEALRTGLAHVCCEWPEDVQRRAFSIAQHLAGKPGDALSATKGLLNELDGSLDDAALDRALEASLSVCGSTEQLTRVAALWKT